LDTAREGTYSQQALEILPARYKKLYFDRVTGGFRIRKRIRDQVVFARQDLVQNPPFVRVDFVSCRNVLIYFEPALQDRVFQIFHYALVPQGTLFLGKSENAPAKYFDTVDKKAKIFRRSALASNLIPVPRNHRPETIFQTRSSDLPNFSEIVPRELIKSLGICAFVVDADTTIVHIVGDTSAYIGIPGGQADFRLSNLLTKSAGVELAILVRKTARDRGQYSSRSHQLASKSNKTRFVFSVRPLDQVKSAGKALFLVTIEPRAAEKAGVKKGKKLTKLEDREYPARMIELEQEILSTREHLQTLIEELEISNEELQSLNEEMSSTNEELQASNEELETTNEEMQASNEELTTLNEEVTTKSSELRAANAHLENVQNSIGAPLVLVDEELRVVRFNSSSNKIFSLTEGDVGSHLIDVSCKCEIPRFDVRMRETVR
ncbi:MAG: hypothetical protein EOO50_17490, partial [Flavobacterium sp.]|uniref:CheR family methyltransferase n=1 Tax=Flavobacterium sp. TaxID=239 RepID=UPI0011FA8B2C